jgi:hypothetical protein
VKRSARKGDNRPAVLRWTGILNKPMEQLCEKAFV